MGRVNLEKLRDALNKLSKDIDLEKFHLMHKMCLEDCEIEMGIVFFDDEENWGKHMTIYDKKEYEVLKEFAEAVEYDCQKVAICKIDEGKAEDYADDCE